MVANGRLSFYLRVLTELYSSLRLLIMPLFPFNNGHMLYETLWVIFFLSVQWGWLWRENHLCSIYGIIDIITLEVCAQRSIIVYSW